MLLGNTIASRDGLGIRRRFAAAAMAGMLAVASSSGLARTPGSPPAPPLCPELAALTAVPAPAGELPKLAIIIDDLGYSLQRGRDTIALPADLTLAILPQSPHGSELARLARESGKEIIAHLPMSTLNGRALDAGALTGGMERREFLRVLEASLANLPGISGVNNHMGSRLTQQTRPMQWLMAELRSRNLYFVDSRTTAATVAARIAGDQGLPTLERDVFLDNERSCAAIARQFARLLRTARREGQAVGIGHPYPETLRFLQSLLPALGEHVDIRPTSDLLSPARKPLPPLDGAPDYHDPLHILHFSR